MRQAKHQQHAIFHIVWKITRKKSRERSELRSFFKSISKFPPKMVKILSARSFFERTLFRAHTFWAHAFSSTRVLKRTLFERTLIERTLLSPSLLERTLLERTLFERTLFERTLFERTLFERALYSKAIEKINDASLRRPWDILRDFQTPCQVENTIIFQVFGDASVAQSVVSKQANGDFFSINWGWGVAVMLGVFVSGGVSGGHLNPAVTLAMALRKKLEWKKVPVYFLAQYLGAFLGAALVYFVYYGKTSYPPFLLSKCTKTSDFLISSQWINFLLKSLFSKWPKRALFLF